MKHNQDSTLMGFDLSTSQYLLIESLISKQLIDDLESSSMCNSPDNYFFQRSKQLTSILQSLRNQYYLHQIAMDYHVFNPPISGVASSLPTDRNVKG